MTNTATAPADTARHDIGTVVRITGDTDVNLGRLGEIVHDTGVWYRLRVDRGAVILFRHAHVELVEGPEAHALRVLLREGRVAAMTELLAMAREDDEPDAEVIAGLGTQLAAALADLHDVLAEVVEGRDYRGELFAALLDAYRAERFSEQAGRAHARAERIATAADDAGVRVDELDLDTLARLHAEPDAPLLRRALAHLPLSI